MTPIKYDMQKAAMEVEAARKNGLVLTRYTFAPSVKGYPVVTAAGFREDDVRDFLVAHGRDIGELLEAEPVPRIVWW